ncbi:MAG TPA: hypothetical protein VHF45_01050, partial [Thermoleophilaceae bacterium]|nr:hypothetical protein [Thermoleophilaceae bacterium]
MTVWKKQPPREHLVAVVAEPITEQHLEALPAARQVPGRLDDVLDEAPAGGVDRRELQFLLRTEVGEQTALAHAELRGEPPDREPLEALHRGQVRGGLEDRLTCAVAAPPPAVGLLRGGRPGLRERLQ